MRRLAVVTIVGLVAIPFVLRLSLLETRGFNPDELEHLHFSWCISKGLLPYVDYFEHHTPGLHYFMALFYPFYDVERVSDDAIGFILMARRWMWLFTGAVIALTFFLGSAWRTRRTGLLAALLLSNTGFFLAKSLELRPAVPASSLLVGAVLLAFSGMRRFESGKPGASFRWFSSGLALGVATMVTQKILFVGPGFAVVAVWFVLDRRLAGTWKRRLRLVVLQSVGFVLPIALTLGYFASRGALWAFIDSNLIINTRWPGLEAGPFLVELTRQDPVYVVLAVIGFVVLARRTFSLDGAVEGEPVVALATLSMVATIPLHPAMTYHHFLLVLPFASLYAAGLVDAAFRKLEARLSWRGAADGALAVLVVLLSIQPLARFRAAFDRGNWGTIQGIGYVLRNTSPWETTLDGFTGLGLFRPQAFFYHFQNSHVFELQTDERHERMLEALETGEALPKLIFWTHYLRDAVTPEMRAFLEKHYVPAGLEPIRIRPFDNGQGWWSDVAPRYLGWDPDVPPQIPHVIFGEGWRVPSIEFGAPVRRTRTRRSRLIVPIRRPRDFEVVFRAHADAEVVPFGVELVVNGQSAGVEEAVPRWQDYKFPVTVHQLRPGFNELELRFSAENDTEDRRLELAVNTMQLVEPNGEH